MTLTSEAISALIEDLPAAGDTFGAARADAIAHHVEKLRHHIGALRGFGRHKLVAALLTGELDDTITEANAIERRKAQRAARPKAVPAEVQ